MLITTPTQLPLQRMIDPILSYIDEKQADRTYNSNLIDIYDGNIRPYVEYALSNSMSSESFNIANNNIVVVNVLKKIIEKLSKVYSEPVNRQTTNEIDQEIMEYYSKELNFDHFMLRVNEYYNLNKYCAIEPFIRDGNPRLRLLNSDDFCVYSDDIYDPTNPTVFIKFAGQAQSYNGEDLVRVYILYSVDQIIIVDDKKEIRVDLMAAQGLDGTNPVGIVPILYIRDQGRYAIPRPDTDLYPMAIDTSVALTNLNYANLFMSHSLIYGIDLDTESLQKLKAAPNKFLNLKSDPQRRQTGGAGTVGAITPQINIPDTLQSIQEKLGLWLSSKGLRPNNTSSIQGNSTNYASGIAKIIDEADAIAIYKEQIILFRSFEADFWYLMSILHNFWLSSDALAEETRGLSSTFDPIISFTIAEPTYSEDVLVDVLIKEISSGLITKADAIKRLNPEFTDGEVREYMIRIREERMDDGLSGAVDFIQTANDMISRGMLPTETSITPEVDTEETA